MYEGRSLDTADASVPSGRVYLLRVRIILPKADRKLPGLRRADEEDKI